MLQLVGCTLMENATIVLIYRETRRDHNDQISLRDEDPGIIYLDTRRELVPLLVTHTKAVNYQEIIHFLKQTQNYKPYLVNINVKGCFNRVCRPYRV